MRVTTQATPLARAADPDTAHRTVRTVGPTRRDARVMRIAGWVAVALVLVLALGAFVPLAAEGVARGERLGGAAAGYAWRVTLFTLWQALLSTVLSLLFAIPVARALARRPRFPGRGLLVSALALPLVLPAIVAALAIVGVWGRQGPINDLIAALGGERVSIYGLAGILVAHVFFNMPLAARLFLRHLEAVPTERWRLAAQLGLSPLAVWRTIEWPAMRAHIGGVALLVFALCATSFAIVLVLGGGPRYTTLEVAIYQALRFDFEPGRAVVLAVIQLALTGAIALALRGRDSEPVEIGTARAPRRYGNNAGWERAVDAVVIGVAAFYLLAPLLVLVWNGLAADLARLAGEPAVRGAVATSLILGVLAASLCMLATVALTLGAHAGGATLRGLSGSVASLVLLVPPTVIGAGWFLALRGTGALFSAAPIMIVVVNAVMALPFAMRIVQPAWARHAGRVDRAALALGMGGWSRLARLDWPAMRPALALAFAFALALSLGDLGVVALFGSQDWTTLPLLLLQRMGSYRTADAAGLALLLAALSLGIVALAALAGRRAA